MFLVDLLGRDTLEAKIFLRLIEKEMKTIFVVSNISKLIAAASMVLLNIYFIFGSILYAQQKPTNWQFMWLQVFSFNLLIDVMYTSSVEVIVLRYAIPAAISNRTAELKEKINVLISKISEINNIDVNDSDTRFSVTDYLFVSSFIAKKRRDVPESSIILQYRSTMPRNINKKFNNLINKVEVPRVTKNQYRGRYFIIPVLLDFTKMLIKLLTISLLQIGALPEFMQTIIIRMSQVY
jgi:hypothetical protein